jgi:hypothetical protein
MVDGSRGQRTEDTACLHYPWAIAPTTIRTKPVATAIATLVSIDKLTSFPPLVVATTSPRLLISLMDAGNGPQFFDLHRYPLRLRLFDAADSRIRRPGTICNRSRPA